jgi:excisionase family DNA binding protein
MSYTNAAARPADQAGKLYATIPQSCERYGLGRSNLYRWIGRGEIRALKLGRRILIEIASADAFFASLPHAAIQPDARDRRAARAAEARRIETPPVPSRNR